MTLTQLKQVNGNFALACQIKGDELEITEVSKLTDYELQVLLNRTTDQTLKNALLTEQKTRR
jgi:hypothetical protein